MNKLALLIMLALGWATGDSTAEAQGERFIGAENVSIAAALGGALLINSDWFQSEFKEGWTYAARVQYRMHPGFALYGDYASVELDPETAVGTGALQVSSAAVGLIFYGRANLTGSVLAFLDMGAASNTMQDADTEWKFRPGGGFDIAVSPQFAVCPSLYVNRYAGSPDYIDGLEFKLWFRLTPFATIL